MTIEANIEDPGYYINTLNDSYPASGDTLTEGDNHIRGIKNLIKNTFPNVTGEVTSTHTELNLLDGVTATTAELNILDGVTATAAEINILDGATLSTAELNILDGVTATFAELNILDGVTATAAEINYLDKASALGTCEAGKVVTTTTPGNVITAATITTLTSTTATLTSSYTSSKHFTGAWKWISGIVSGTGLAEYDFDGATVSAALAGHAYCMFVFRNLYPTNNSDTLRMRVQISGTTWVTGTDYTGSSNASIVASGGISNSTTAGGVSGFITIYNPGTTAYRKIIDIQTVYEDTTATPAPVEYRNGDDFSSLSAITGVRFYMSTGTINLGRIDMYVAEEI